MLKRCTSVINIWGIQVSLEESKILQQNQKLTNSDATHIIMYISVVLSFCIPFLWLTETNAFIQRQKIVQAYNVHRNASSKTTPLQVGNGNFAFGVDVTGLQTFSPFATMSTWAWHNFSLPTTPNQTSVKGETRMIFLAEFEN